MCGGGNLSNKNKNETFQCSELLVNLALRHRQIYSNQVNLTPQLDIEAPAGLVLTENHTRTVNLRARFSISLEQKINK